MYHCPKCNDCRFYQTSWSMGFHDTDCTLSEYEPGFVEGADCPFFAPYDNYEKLRIEMHQFLEQLKKERQTEKRN